MEIKKLNRDNLGDVINLYIKMRETLVNKFWFKEVELKEWENLIADGCIFGAFNEDGRLVGISAIELDVPSYKVSKEFERIDLKLGEVGYFIVDEDFRGRGILNEINTYLLNTAKSFGFNALCALIHPSNLPAIKGFSKLGKLEYAGNLRMDGDFPGVVYGVRI